MDHIGLTKDEEIEDGCVIRVAKVVLKGGDAVGARLQLLSRYFPGYSVTASGAVVGLIYGFVSGF